MDGPVRRVVKYNFDHYRKKGWVGRLLFVGKESVWKAIASVKRSTDFEISKGETRHGFLCLIFSQKENPIVQFAMRISGSF